ncbi:MULTISPECIES: NapC/NirT family cytochrome c [Photobacterium]|uniref:Denitrification system component NirT n=2 Tax=Photobacterium TaxID=657 RepID=A0A2T3J9M1_9GAMM|nr:MULTISPECIES: NapC/NirT family cytochrome c [Photobacterium]PSU45491.1 Denitrification system component NirT [Photobacterium frigidiphilum]PSV49679.1 Denitrification system component NirT [Photobacterium indicum]
MKFKLLPAKLWSLPKKWWLFGIPIGGIITFFVGIIFWGGFNTAMEMTNTTAFCATSCHEMRQAVVPEWQRSVHYTNRSGVQAGCPDCHVPEPWVDKMIRKMQASMELYHKMVGTIDNMEKFEEHRLTMARRVWKAMQKTDSRECRNCHQLQHMNPDVQQKMKHEFLYGTARTCIDCHRGIAHQLPQGLFPDEVPMVTPPDLNLDLPPLDSDDLLKHIKDISNN